MRSFEENEICMVFDEETGNAIDAFEYTSNELRRRADQLDGLGYTTIEANDIVIEWNTQ